MAHLLTTYSVIFSANKKCRLSGVTTRKRQTGKSNGADIACLHFTQKRAVRKDAIIYLQVAAYAASLLY